MYVCVKSKIDRKTFDFFLGGGVRKNDQCKGINRLKSKGKKMKNEKK